MLVINQRQLDAMIQVRMAGFERKLVAHLLNAWPRECRQAGGEPQIARAVKLILPRAQGHGYETERELTLYTSLTLILGFGFDTDPQLDWAGSALRNAAIADLTVRIERLYDETVEYLGAIGGKDAGLVVRAMLRVKNYDTTHAPVTEGEKLAEDLCGVLRQFWPEKLAFQGAAPTMAMIRDGIARARDHGLESPVGRGLFVSLQFMLGHEFDIDPLHPWAGAALTHPDDKTETDRIVRLYQVSFNHIDQSLTRAQGQGA